MTALTFPHNVLGTAIPIDGFSNQRQPAGDRSEMDSGLARFRVTNLNPLRRVTVGWHWNQFQTEYFNAWMEYRARYGALWINIKLPLDFTPRTVLSRFVDQVSQAVYQRTRFTLAATLEVRDINVVNAADFTTIETQALTSIATATATMAAKLAALP